MNSVRSLPEQTDTVVIGGGTAGCVIAARLAAAGRTVLVLEAGPDYGPLADGDWPAELLDAAELPTTHDWGYEGTGAAGQPLAYDRARVIGGCSAHNGCSQSVGWAGDYDAWAAAGCPGWGAADLAPLFTAAAEQLRFRRYTQEEIQPFQREFIRACRQSGIPALDDLDDLGASQSVGCAPVNVRDLTRINTAFGYLDAQRARPNLTVAADALVDRIHFREGAVEAVTVTRHGLTSRVGARDVVLAAGAYGSPEVLLRSGIGPAAHLEDLGIALVSDRPGVGANLHDHPAVLLEFAGTAELQRDLAEFSGGDWLPQEQSVVKLRSPVSDGPYDLHVYPWVEPDPAQEYGWRCILPVSQLRPRSRGTVRLASRALGVRAIVDPRFFSDAAGADLESVRHGLRWTAENVLPRMDRHLGTPLHKPVPPDDEGMDDWIRRHHSHYWHPAGTCAMGDPADPTTVVDHQGRVVGVTGLRIADASVFPDIPRATPALPTVVVAERIAAFMTATTT
ncbi:GMC family oxidoreductase [Streptomyces sp. BH-SS-21]|uniref:GMC family oxidoreductase n=1 Tax=Streptomyces liliiviolaceus TaxID=2823109 RepID=A0A940Y2D6_9ACTN|nr:GMC family oxidoreductase [Streptomyces liliiviolaceus]